jgi:hypothetical protein
MHTGGVPFLSIVVPTFNEGERIAAFIEGMREAAARLVDSWEIVVADDGSADNTREIVAAIAATHPNVRLLALPHRGKGATVRDGLLDARGTWRFMADADLSMPPDNLERFLTVIRNDPAASLIIGSREVPGAQRTGEPWLRHVIGRIFNWTVRLFALAGFTDTQCGYKLFSRQAVDTICPHLTMEGFAFDVEMLVLARRAGLVVREVGITWRGHPESRVAWGRGAIAFVDVLRVAWADSRGEYDAASSHHRPIERIGGLGVRAWAYVITGVFAASFAYDLLHIPVQVFDALEEILAAYRSPSVSSSFWDAAFNVAYLRPLRIAQIKGLFDVAQGHYWLTYRGFHVLLLVACLLLFTRALRVRTTVDLCAAAFALTVLTGLHTFRALIQEAFPINHFLEIVVLALVTLNLAQARPRGVIDVAAAATFTVAALTLESGLLIWIVAISAWIAGLRGISGRGIGFMTILLAGYFYVRFVSLSVGTPGLIERSSGFIFETLDPPQLQERFGDRLAVFYGYNVLASALSVLFSEPQGGIFVVTRSWLNGEMPLRFVLAVFSSVTTTALILAAAVQRTRRREWDSTDCVLVVFAAILMANAVLSFAYTKDDIMTVAGALYALAAYVAIRHVGYRLPNMRWLSAAVLTVLIAAVGTAWSIRSLGVHQIARTAAFKTRNDWARQPGEWKRNGRWPSDAAEQRLILRLRDDALAERPPNPVFEPEWAYQVWGD